MIFNPNDRESPFPEAQPHPSGRRTGKKKSQKIISALRSFQIGWNVSGKYFILIFPLHVTAFTKLVKSIRNTFFKVAPQVQRVQDVLINPSELPLGLITSKPPLFSQVCERARKLQIIAS